MFKSPWLFFHHLLWQDVATGHASADANYESYEQHSQYYTSSASSNQVTSASSASYLIGPSYAQECDDGKSIDILCAGPSVFSCTYLSRAQRCLDVYPAAKKSSTEC
ncbi:hypothetical protein EDB19DRAFT_681682 [Suillus lakei]|nr:hypothetical protein EDB19DRAFT_681682 [Suillus lakei]